MFRRGMKAVPFLCLFLGSYLTNNGVLSVEYDGTDTDKPVAVVVHQLEGVVPLTDANFEHETQASTGQTTGSWLVWLYQESASSISRSSIAVDIRGTVPTAEVWSELYTVVASMNVGGDGRGTYERLRVPTILPSFVFIHKGKMYAYPVPTTTGTGTDSYSWDDIVSFCKDPSQVSPALDIPAPPSWFDALRQARITADPSHNMVLICGAVMLVVVALFILAVLGHFGSKASEDKAKVA